MAGCISGQAVRSIAGLLRYCARPLLLAHLVYIRACIALPSVQVQVPAVCHVPVGMFMINHTRCVGGLCVKSSHHALPGGLARATMMCRPRYVYLEACSHAQSTPLTCGVLLTGVDRGLLDCKTRSL